MTVLQLAAMLPATEAVLQSRYDVRFFADPAAREAWLAEHASDVRAVVTGGHHGIETSLAERLPNLGLVAVNGVGYDRIDTDAMRALGVRVSNTPDVLTDDVADLAVALMLNVMRALPAAEQHVRAGLWPSAQPPLTRRASGLRYGIVGLGRIGQAIAQRLAGFGGSIAYTSQTRKQTDYPFFDTAVALAQVTDVLFIATAASAATRGMIDRDVIAALGPRGVIVNIARGSIIDETELIAALVEGRLGGAGLDVFADEPGVPAVLRALPNVSLAPHIGSATAETRAAMGNLMLENLEAFFAGRILPTAVA